MTDKPYDEYVDRAVQKVSTYSVSDTEEYVILKTEKYCHSMPLRELRHLLTAAWLDGLAYSLNLVEGEKEKRNPLRTRLRDEPVTFEGGTGIRSAIIYETCPECGHGWDRHHEG